MFLAAALGACGICCLGAAVAVTGLLVIVVGRAAFACYGLTGVTPFKLVGITACGGPCLVGLCAFTKLFGAATVILLASFGYAYAAPLAGGEA